MASITGACCTTTETVELLGQLRGSVRLDMGLCPWGLGSRKREGGCDMDDQPGGRIRNWA